jgi:DNA-binding MurR/RpiR family transcriptional regulator
VTVDDIAVLLQQAWPSLSPQLQQAARYILAHPEEVALSSMRRVAAQADVQPSTMVRLSRAIGFAGFDEMRRPYCDWLRGGEGAYEARAKALRTRDGGCIAGIVSEMIASDTQALAESCCGPSKRPERLEAAATRLWAARRIYVLGLRSCFSLAHYFHYTCSMVHADCRLVDGAGATYRDGLQGMTGQDVLLVFSFRPYAQDAVDLTAEARMTGAAVIAVTDPGASPVVVGDDISLTVDTSSANFFQSFTAAQAVAQQLLAALVLVSGDQGLAAIKASEARLKTSAAYWQEPKRRRRPAL